MPRPAMNKHWCVSVCVCVRACVCRIFMHGCSGIAKGDTSYVQMIYSNKTVKYLNSI